MREMTYLGQVQGMRELSSLRHETSASPTNLEIWYAQDMRRVDQPNTGGELANQRHGETWPAQGMTKCWPAKDMRRDGPLKI